VESQKFVSFFPLVQSENGTRLMRVGDVDPSVVSSFLSRDPRDSTWTADCGVAWW